MQFRVVPAVDADDSTPPQFLQLPAIAPLPAATRHAAAGADREGDDRLRRRTAKPVEGPVEALLGTVDGTDVPTERDVDGSGDREPGRRRDRGVGDLQHHRRRPPDAHPRDRLRGRQPAAPRRRRRGRVVQPIQLDGDPIPPEPWETGVKDTVIAYPGQVTRVKARFNTPGQFVWHCHIVEHEDNEMMRPYRIGPRQPGQPD